MCKDNTIVARSWVQIKHLSMFNLALLPYWFWLFIRSWSDFCWTSVGHLPQIQISGWANIVSSVYTPYTTILSPASNPQFKRPLASTPSEMPHSLFLPPSLCEKGNLFIWLGNKSRTVAGWGKGRKGSKEYRLRNRLRKKNLKEEWVAWRKEQRSH